MKKLLEIEIVFVEKVGVVHPCWRYENGEERGRMQLNEKGAGKAEGSRKQKTKK